MTWPDRWQTWVDGVLSRLDNPNGLLRLIQSRRAGIDEDDHDAEDTVEHFRAWLRSRLASHRPDSARVKIPSLLAAQVLRELKTTMTDRQAALYLKQLAHPQLLYFNDGSERGYLWIGEDTDDETLPIPLTYEPRRERR